jgi:DNA invertase Pin-like site-specific DNA recombinase
MLIDSGVEVLFADLPELKNAMGRFMLTTMASLTELEAGLISERTKSASPDFIMTRKRGRTPSAGRARQARSDSVIVLSL